MKTKVKITACLILIIMLFSSCAKEAAYIDDESDDSPLTIYLASGQNFYSEAITKYNQMINSGELDGRKIDIIEFNVDDSEAVYDKISTEVASGLGPDFLVIGGRTLYSNIYKIMENGATADMDILIGNNPDFDPDDYKMDILDAGIIGSKRCFMPLGYSVPYIITTKENFEECDIEIPNDMDIDRLLNIIMKFTEEERYVGFLSYLDMYALLDAIHNYPSIQTMNNEYCEKVMKALDLFYNEYPACKNYSGYTDELGAGSASAIIQDDTYFSFSQYVLASIFYSDLKNKYHKTPVVLSVPINIAGESVAYVGQGIAININSKHKNDAFKFILFLLSEEAQLGISELRDNAPVLPVNKVAYEKAKERFLNGDYLGSSMPPTQISTEFYNQFINVIEGYDDVIFTAEAFYIYMNVFADIPDESYEQKVEEMDRRLRLYFSE